MKCVRHLIDMAVRSRGLGWARWWGGGRRLAAGGKGAGTCRGELGAGWAGFRDGGGGEAVVAALDVVRHWGDWGAASSYHTLLK